MAGIFNAYYDLVGHGCLAVVFRSETMCGRTRDGERWMEDSGENRAGVRPVEFPRASAKGLMENPVLVERIEAVLRAIPEAVRRDFSEDPQFHMAVDDYVPGKGRSVWMACPKPYGNGSRSVVLKPQLADRPRDFALYVIAHELAHAHLRNGGWNDIQDPEKAADALAESWGFGRPPSNPMRDGPVLSGGAPRNRRENQTNVVN